MFYWEYWKYPWFSFWIHSLSLSLSLYSALWYYYSLYRAPAPHAELSGPTQEQRVEFVWGVVEAGTGGEVWSRHQHPHLPPTAESLPQRGKYNWPTEVSCVMIKSMAFFKNNFGSCVFDHLSQQPFSQAKPPTPNMFKKKKKEYCYQNK